VKGDKIDPDTKERIDEIMDELRELGVNISVREKVLKSRVRELGDEALMRLKPRGKKLKY
jgi:predicted peroxiredoxin